MQTLKNAIKIYRGESFTIDKIVKNEDGTPYIVPKLNNPYFLLSISNSQYDETERFVRNYWLSVKRTFVNSKPLHLNELRFSEQGEVLKSFDEITSFPVQAYYKGLFCEIDDDFAVFTDGKSFKCWNVEYESGTGVENITGNGSEETPYIISGAGEIVIAANYHVPVRVEVKSGVKVSLDREANFYTDANDKNSSIGNSVRPASDSIFYVYSDTKAGVTCKLTSLKVVTEGWSDYSCRLVAHFSAEDTRGWNVATYMYSLQLVDGTPNRLYLEGLCLENDIPFLSSYWYDDASLRNSLTRTSDEELYDLLLQKGIVFPQDYDVQQPLGMIHLSYPILGPTELKVTNYLQGGVVW